MKIEGYTKYAEFRDVKYYYSKTKDNWVNDINKLYLGDLNHNKIEVNIDDFPKLKDCEIKDVKITLEVEF